MTRMAKRLQMLGIALALMQPVLLAACGSEQAPSTSTGANPTATTAERDAPTSAETDREALVALYNSTDGPNWDDAQNWLSDRPLQRMARCRHRGRTRNISLAHLSRIERRDTEGVGQSH